MATLPHRGNPYATAGADWRLRCARPMVLNPQCVLRIENFLGESAVDTMIVTETEIKTVQESENATEIGTETVSVSASASLTLIVKEKRSMRMEQMVKNTKVNMFNGFTI